LKPTKLPPVAIHTVVTASGTSQALPALTP
jgi:hypothetical protein